MTIFIKLLIFFSCIIVFSLIAFGILAIAIFIFSFIAADAIKKIDNPPIDIASQDTLTAQDIAWFGWNPDKTCNKHLGSPCQFCGLRIEEQ